jgi:hypothetical protein
MCWLVSLLAAGDGLAMMHTYVNESVLLSTIT